LLEIKAKVELIVKYEKDLGDLWNEINQLKEQIKGKD